MLHGVWGPPEPAASLGVPHEWPGRTGNQNCHSGSFEYRLFLFAVLAPVNLREGVGGAGRRQVLNLRKESALCLELA